MIAKYSWSAPAGRSQFIFVLAVAYLVIFANLPALSAPPFSGTIFIDPDIVTAADHTSFQTLIDKGRGTRTMFDRRVNNWITVNAFLFEAQFTGGGKTEVQVNPEFGTVAAARAEALRYQHAVGQLPAVLRKDVKTMWVHKGLQPFGGGNSNLLVHSDQATDYINNGILEETFMHEASHTSLDAPHGASAGWLAAQASDPEFISTYARDNSTREDIAETFLTWFAARFRKERITPTLLASITNAVPNRLKYFDDQHFNLYPAVYIEFLAVAVNKEAKMVELTWRTDPQTSYFVESSDDLRNWTRSAAPVSSTAQQATTSLPFADIQSGRFFRIVLSQ